MGMKNSQQDAVAHLEARLGKDQASAATAVRLLTHGASPEAKCSFFLNLVQLGGENRSCHMRS